MIDELHVENVALIREATIRPSEGLTVLTGETGAGKSALLSSVKLLMGERADAGAVREGANALVVEGRLFVRGGDPDGTVVSRRVSADGRGRVTIDGSMAPVRELAQGIGATIDLCGQHEHQRLLQQASHVELLDSWGLQEIGEAKDAYVSALSHARAKERELERVRQMSQTAAERVEEAEFVLRRIDEVDPKEGELEELEEQLPRAQHAETLIRAAEGARSALAGDGGALDLMQDALGEIRAAQRFDGALSKLVDSLESALIEAEDVAAELREYRDEVDFDPAVLDEMQSRMAQIQGLLRSYGPGIQNVLNRRAAAEEIVKAAHGGDEMVKRVQKERDEAESALLRAAKRLDRARMGCAPRLADAIGAQMARLEMGSAALEFSFEPLPRSQWTQAGPSRVELMYRPAAGLSARPLRRIASGGEVSRVMLACKVVLGEADSTETLVFDEVDAGVGGATAVALAEVLAQLAETHQVLVVTHLAQVAVRASRHFLVRKTDAENDKTPQTTIEEIRGEERVSEVARMLSGDASDASMAHAREMLS